MRAGWRIRRFTDGSAIVAARVWRTLVPVGADGEVRLLASLIRGAAALWAGNGLLTVAHQSPWWMAGGSCLWCAAAWRASDPACAKQPEQAAEQHSDAEIYDDAVTRLRSLVGDRNGVLLSTVLADWQEQGWVAPEVTGAELGRQLQRRGIPVRASLKVAGSVGPGVHRDDLPAAAAPLPQPLPDAPSVAVG